MNTLVAQGFERTLSMTLHRNLTSGQWFVDQIEARYGPVRNNLRFVESLPLTEAFTPVFLEQLKVNLPKNLNQQVISISGVAIATKTIVIKGLRVLVQTARHGVQKVIVRFKAIFGQLFDFLSPQYRPELMPGSAAELPGIEDQAVDVLDIKIPKDCLFCPKREKCEDV